MGLDSYWRRRSGNQIVEANDVKLPRELQLVGGMFSDHGDGSFRGKVYAPFIKAATNVDIYQDVIDNDVVKVMAERLEKTEIVRRPYDISLQEFEDLRTMFRTYADAGCCLVGWW